MHLYLVRHGQSYVNLPDWTGEDLDMPLTPIGEQQAEAVAQWIAEHVDAGRLYASTLKRTQQTAQPISEKTGLEIVSDYRIREVGTNAPDGTALSTELMDRYEEGIWGTLNPYDAITPNGENWMQFRTRIGVFIESIIAQFDNYNPKSPEAIKDQTILIVCHGGVIEAFYEYVFEKGPWSVVSVITRNTGITHLEYRPMPQRPEWRLHYHNRLEHLTPEQIT